MMRTMIFHFLLQSLMKHPMKHHSAVFPYLRGAYKTDGGQLMQADNNKTREDSFKLKEEIWISYHGDIPIQSVGAPTLEELKARLDGGASSKSGSPVQGKATSRSLPTQIFYIIL